jgi:hypothetical protein
MSLAALSLQSLSPFIRPGPASPRPALQSAVDLLDQRVPNPSAAQLCHAGALHCTASPLVERGGLAGRAAALPQLADGRPETTAVPLAEPLRAA